MAHDITEALAALADEYGFDQTRPGSMPVKKKGEDVVPPPQIARTTNNGYLFVWYIKADQSSLGIRIDHPRFTGLELQALLTVYSQSSPKAPLVTLMAKTRWQMRSSSHTNSQVTALNRRFESNWDARLQQVHDYLEENLEMGGSLRWLGQGEAPPAVKHLIFPLLEEKQHSIIAAYGGSTKSLLGLACAISLARGESILPNCKVDRSVKTLYLDWEADGDVHDDRFRQLLKGHQIAVDDINQHIGHLRLTVPLADAYELVYNHIRKNGFELLIVDSASRAVGGDTIDESAVISYFNTTASFEISILTIAHKPKDERSKGPSGNSHWFHQARNYWELQKDQVHGDPTVDLAITHEKANNNKLQRSLGFKLTFDPEAGIRYQWQDPAENASNSSNLPPIEKLIAFLKTNPNSTTRMIADSGIGMKQNYIAMILKGGEGKTFRGSGAPGSKGREWALLTRDSSLSRTDNVIPFDDEGWSE